MHRKTYFIILICSLWMGSCKQEPKAVVVENRPDPSSIQVPSFTPDSAYAYIEKQLSFGPRSPNSPGHQACKEWIVNTCQSMGLSVIEQDFDAQTYTGIAFPATNIIGQYNPDAKSRILLAAHWDTRFIAEEDPDESRKDKPIPGADDGGSGVGVLLEIARTLQTNPIDLGVDFIFFDAEDQGERGSTNTESWCLGAQYWSRNSHPGYIEPKYGILLDMVGGRNARFAVEDVRQMYPAVHAGKVIALYTKVWKLAQSMGKGNYFSSASVPAGIDDHYFVNSIKGIPMIDIINKPQGSPTSFMEHWHTHADDIQHIDKRTLRAVGQVVLAVIYRENGQLF